MMLQVRVRVNRVSVCQEFKDYASGVKNFRAYLVEQLMVGSSSNSKCQIKERVQSKLFGAPNKLGCAPKIAMS